MNTTDTEQETQRDMNCVLKRGVCDSWRKIQDYWWECPISEEKKIKHAASRERNKKIIEVAR